MHIGLAARDPAREPIYRFDTEQASADPTIFDPKRRNTVLGHPKTRESHPFILQPGPFKPVFRHSWTRRQAPKKSQVSVFKRVFLRKDSKYLKDSTTFVVVFFNPFGFRLSWQMRDSLQTRDVRVYQIHCAIMHTSEGS